MTVVKNKALKFIIPLSVWVILGYLMLNFADIPAILSSGVISHISFNSIFLLMFLNLLTFLSLGLILRNLLQSFDIRLSVSEGVGVASLTYMGNYLTIPGGGAVGKAVYLKRKYNFSYHNFFASMSATHILDLMYISILGITMVILCGGLSEVWGLPVISAFVVAGIISVWLVAFPFNFRNCRGKFFNTLRDVVEGWKIIRKDRLLIARISVLLLMNHLLAVLEVVVGYDVFSVEIGIVEAALLALISTLSTIVKITPANLGIQEAVIAASSHLLGIGFEEGLMVAGCLRLVAVVVTFFMGGVFGFRLLNPHNVGDRNEGTARSR